MSAGAAEGEEGGLVCAHCGSPLPEGAEECGVCDGGLAAVAPPEEAPAAPAEPAEMTPESSRRFHYFEIALVLGVGFLWAVIYSLRAWWSNRGLSPETELGSLDRILDAGLSISVLAYVLYWQGRSLRTLGLIFRRSDLVWAVVIVGFDWLMMMAIRQNVRGLAWKHFPVGTVGPLQWLAVIPSAAKEELIVRAFLMTEVAELSGSWALAVLTSVGFQTIYHLYQGTPAALMAAGGFFVSAVFYASTRRITPVILAHSLHNFWIMASW
ncbi:MAG TPA: CPBP family intramembrane glutamic endopeptidase [Thermoanaerobaculia bacterium]